MVFIKDDLINEINKLNNNLKKKIFLNEFKNNKIKSNFINYINNDKIKELDNLLYNGCINEKNLFDLSEKKIIDDLEVCILYKINLYRTYYGFLTKKKEDEFYKKNKNNLIYIGNKYFCYYIARIYWGGINSYLVDKKLVLLDFFNVNNIIKIIELSYKYIKNIDERNKFIKYLKLFTGYNVSLSEQIKEFSHRKYIVLYDKPYIEDYTYQYCNYTNNYIKELNPLTLALNNMDVKHYVFDVLFNSILNNINIDGIICKPILSNFYMNGIYEQEEIVLNTNSFINKLKFDKKDKICWVNYNLKNNLNFKNILLKATFFSNIFKNLENKVEPNENFSLFRFYQDNEFNFTKINNKKYILSYNLHYFTNLSEFVDRDSNIKNILNFIKYYKDNIEICIFQEASFKDNTEKDNFILNMKNMNFKYYYNTINGGNDLYLYCFTKNKYKHKIIENEFLLTNKIKYTLNKFDKYPLYKNINTTRNFILLYYDKLIICMVHLNIGYRLKRFNENLNKLIIKFNSYLRIEELKKIIKYNPNMIIGDFNFEVNSYENIFLKKNNYYLMDNNNDNSTPYNRVDHIYYNKNTKLHNYLIKCNYSDHLPLFQEIPTK